MKNQDPGTVSSSREVKATRNQPHPRSAKGGRNCKEGEPVQKGGEEG